MAKFISQPWGNEDLHFSYTTVVHGSAHKDLMMINKCHPFKRSHFTIENNWGVYEQCKIADCRIVNILA